MPEQNPNTDGKKRSAALDGIVKAERLTQIAFVLPAAVLIGWGMGALLDKWLHTQWIYIVGVVFGGIAGLTEAVRQALRTSREK
jgi:ATP synthase protein I